MDNAALPLRCPECAFASLLKIRLDAHIALHYDCRR